MKDETWVKIVGFLCLITGYGIAAFNGYDGILFTAVMTIIAGGMGIEIGYKRGAKIANKEKAERG